MYHRDVHGLLRSTGQSSRKVCHEVNLEAFFYYTIATKKLLLPYDLQYILRNGPDNYKNF